MQYGDWMQTLTKPSQYTCCIFSSHVKSTTCTNLIQRQSNHSSKVFSLTLTVF